MLAMFVGGLCKGIIGVALPLVGISIMVMLLDPKLAVAMIVIPIFLTNLQMAMRSGFDELMEALLRFWPLIVTCFTTLFTVALFATQLSSSVIVIGLGLALLVFVLANVSPWETLSPSQCGKTGRRNLSVSCQVPLGVLRRFTARPSQCFCWRPACQRTSGQHQWE